jgi:hypothetical protein
MQKEEVLIATRAAWENLSKKRGFHVSVDSPVCIFICTMLQQQLPDMRLARIDIPKAQDFEAVLVGEVDGKFSVVDPAHLTWSKKKLPQEPDLQKATLILPIHEDFDAKKAIAHWEELEPAY